MVRLAKRAQLASNEFRIVAAVRFYVIETVAGSTLPSARQSEQSGSACS